MDVIVFAIVAILIVFKLRKILGNEYGSIMDTSHKKNTKKGILPKTSEKESKKTFMDVMKVKIEDGRKSSDNLMEKNNEVGSELTDFALKHESLNDDFMLVKSIIENFNINDFIVAAKIAFEYVWSCYQEGKIENLKGLCHNNIIQKLYLAIEQNKANSVTEYIHLLKISNVIVNSVSAKKTKIDISLEIDSLQIHYLEDKDGKIVDGSKDSRVEAKEIWKFSKSIANKASEWVIVDISVR